MFALGIDEKRTRQPEVMDDPRLDPPRHLAALRGLARLNVLSCSARTLWQPIKALAEENGLRHLRLLDVATGSADVPVKLWELARRSNIELEVTGVDVSRRALEFAQERARRCGAPLSVRQLNVLQADLPGGFDVVVTSLFLHHLENDQAVDLLRKMRSAARRLVLVNDLVRGTSGLWLAQLASRLFTDSDVAQTDALLSVRAAFTIPEVRRLAAAAGLDGAEIRRRWPCRYLLSWQPSPASAS
jgi:SAM-dependent methyltransferase